MNKLICICISVLMLASCNNSGNQKMVDLTPNNPVISAPADSNKQVTTNTSAKQNNTEAGALNPRHGQPGHRCDIPEGAPLNSPANAGTTLPNSSAAPVITSQPSKQPANNTVKLNPAHGEPGHDCAIPVGQPLKS